MKENQIEICQKMFAGNNLQMTQKNLHVLI